MTDIYDRVAKERTKLLILQPFFGVLAMRLELVETTDIPSSATDGKQLMFNPDFVKPLTPHQLRGLIAHEVLHCAYHHMLRRGNRDPIKWNVACDYAINLHLKESNFILPDGALIDTAYAGMTADQIYNLLPDNSDELTWCTLCDAPQGKEVTQQNDWDLAVRNAIETAKAAGKLPESIQRQLKDILDPVIDWRAVLWPFFTNLNDADYSWSKPNRAYISEDEYFPSMKSDALGEVAVCIDTSGSITKEELTQFWAEIYDIVRMQQPSKVHIISCDYQVHQQYSYDSYDFPESPIDLIGGGGTKFSPAIEAVQTNFTDTEAIVYLTDLESNDFGEAPDTPIIWVSTNKNHTPPFGEVAYMDVANA